MLKRLLITCVVAVAAVTAALADSPLTSTNFWKIYNVTGEKEQYFPPYQVYDMQGWGNEVMDILCGSDYTLEQRLCLVNYIGWNFEGQQHYQDLLGRYVEIKGLESKQEAVKNMQGEMLIVFAYVKALDDYFNVAAAKRMAAEAEKRCPESKAVAMIAALVKAQAAMDNDWGAIYRLCHKAETRKYQKEDFSDAAVWAIMSYINLYMEY